MVGLYGEYTLNFWNFWIGMTGVPASKKVLPEFNVLWELLQNECALHEQV
jgi:hypothetical protein